MTMACTAQNGPGPRIVALCLKVFIVVMFYVHERLGILCTAQPEMDFLAQLNKHCSGMSVCGNCGQQPDTLCEQFCRSGCPPDAQMPSMNTIEVLDGIIPPCNWNQTRQCVNSDAVVCRQSNLSVWCVHRSDPQSTFCVYRHQNMTYTSCEPPVFTSTVATSDPSMGVEGDTQGTTTAQNTTAGAGTSKAATQATSSQAARVQATTSQAASVQATTSQAATVQDTSSQAATVQGTSNVANNNQPITSENNTASIVLGSLFALLLLLVIIGALIFYFRRQGRLPSFLKQTSNPAGLSSVPLEARDASRSKLPDPPVPGGNMEYSYAYDHRPAKPGAKEDPDQDDHTYYSVGVGGYREGNPRYVSDGQMKIPATKKPDTSTDDAKDHPCFVLNRNDDSDESGSERGERHENGDEVTDSSTGVKPREGTDDYTSLVPTGDPKSRSKQPGKEDYVSPTLANESDVRSPPVESPTDVDDDSYFPLIQAAAPKSTVKQSGYEDAKIPTSTSPSEVQPSNCDDDTYTPLALTVEPKSQNEHSGYEAATILKPGSAAITDDMSPYDHLHRQEENESREGALSTVDVDDYQHLVNN